MQGVNGTLCSLLCPPLYARCPPTHLFLVFCLPDASFSIYPLLLHPNNIMEEKEIGKMYIVRVYIANDLHIFGIPRYKITPSI